MQIPNVWYESYILGMFVTPQDFVQNVCDKKQSCSCRLFLVIVPAQNGSVTHRRGGRGHCRVAPVHLGAEGPFGLGELVEVGWVQCWASTIR